MKHYFYTINYYEVRFTQPIYSPVGGVVLYVTEGDSGADDWRVDYEQRCSAPKAGFTPLTEAMLLLCIRRGWLRQFQ
jgi:hypothetical protein